MSNQYNNLSNYLNNSLNDNIINEGLFDILFGKSKPSAEQKTTGNIFGGILGSIASLFKGTAGSATETEDPLVKAYKDMADKEQSREQKRLEDELKAENDLEISKLWAKFETKQHNLDLKTAQKVAAYGAKKKQLDNYKNLLGSKKLIQSDEAIEAMLTKISKIGEDMGTFEDSPLKNLADLATEIMITEDGGVRSLEEIEAIVQPLDEPTKKDNETDKEFEKRKAAFERKKEIRTRLGDETIEDLKEKIKNYDKIAEKYKKPLLSSIQSEDYNKEFGKFTANTLKNEEIQQREEVLNTNEKEWNRRVELYNAYHEFKKKNKDAKDKYKEAENKQAELTEDPFIKNKYNDNTGEVEPLDTDAFKVNLKELFKQKRNDFKTEDDKIDSDKLSVKLKELGISDVNAQKIADKLKDSNFDEGNGFDTTIDAAIDDIDDDGIKEEAKNVAKNKTEQFKNAKNAVETTKEELEKNPDPTTEAGWTKIQETHKDDDNIAKINEILSSKEAKKEWEDGCYDANNTDNNSPYTTYKTKFKDERTEIDKAKKNLKNSQTTNKQLRAEAIGRINGRNKNTIPEEIKDEVKKKIDGCEAGEKKNDKGQIGFTDASGKWIPKPSNEDTDKAHKEYQKLKDLHILTMSAEELNIIDSVTKNSDSNTYTITYTDGSTKDDASKDEAIEAMAERNKSKSDSANILDRKQKLAEGIKSCIGKDGELDPDKIDKLSDLDKAAIGIMIKDKDGFSKYFKGVDLGTDTASELEDALKDKKSNFADILDNIDDAVYKKAFKDKAADKADVDGWEDVEDEDEDAKDEKDYDSDEDDDENAKDAEGNNLKKYDDKWYKESDFNDDGTLKDDAQPVDDENITKQKKKIENPAKTWKRRKRKNGNGMTKSYYNKNGDSITSNEYDQKMEAYKKAKKKSQGGTPDHSSYRFTDFKHMLLESIAEYESKQNINSYNKLKEYLTNNLSN